jgi:hypothetical protein
MEPWNPFQDHFCFLRLFPKNKSRVCEALLISSGQSFFVLFILESEPGDALRQLTAVVVITQQIKICCRIFCMILLAPYENSTFARTV